jgi:3',5'-cyclic AMP phosphodiesterase CpdA
MQTPPRVSAGDATAAVLAAAAAQYAASAGDADACTFVCISDTHGQHAALPPLPAGDVLVHAGDFTVHGSLAETRDFAAWWHAQPHAQKVLIAGNHDKCLARECGSSEDEDDDLGAGVDAGDRRVTAEALLAGPGSHYLCDSAVVTARGAFRVWGSPFQPRFWGAFNLPRGDAIAAKWALIPDGTHVVVTHGPAAGHGDFVPRRREHVGCEDLLREVRLLRRSRCAERVC